MRLRVTVKPESLLKQWEALADPSMCSGVRFSRICATIGGYVRRTLNGHETGKTVFGIIGYSADDLRSHFEGLFTPEMSWDNYGTVWHVDHKRPIASFSEAMDLRLAVRKCWALSNIQPMLKVNNLSKGSKWNGVYHYHQQRRAPQYR